MPTCYSVINQSVTATTNLITLSGFSSPFSHMKINFFKLKVQSNTGNHYIYVRMKRVNSVDVFESNRSYAYKTINSSTINFSGDPYNTNVVNVNGGSNIIAGKFPIAYVNIPSTGEEFLSGTLEFTKLDVGLLINSHIMHSSISGNRLLMNGSLNVYDIVTIYIEGDNTSFNFASGDIAIWYT